jgi:hypothetical protein
MSVVVNGGQTKMDTIAGLGFSLGVFIIGLILVLFMKEEKNR